MGDLTARTGFHLRSTPRGGPNGGSGNGQISTDARKGKELILPNRLLYRFEKPHSGGVAKGMVRPLQLDLPPHPHGNLDVSNPSGPKTPSVLVGNPHLNKSK